MTVDEMLERLSEDLVSIEQALQTFDVLAATQGSLPQYSEELASLMRTAEEVYEAFAEIWDRSRTEAE